MHLFSTGAPDPCCPWGCCQLYWTVQRPSAANVEQQSDSDGKCKCVTLSAQLDPALFLTNWRFCIHVQGLEVRYNQQPCRCIIMLRTFNHIAGWAGRFCNDQAWGRCGGKGGERGFLLVQLYCAHNRLCKSCALFKCMVHVWLLDFQPKCLTNKILLYIITCMIVICMKFAPALLGHFPGR